MRLTLDIDGRERDWWAYAAFYSLRDSGLFWKVELWRTRKGYHVVAFGGLDDFTVDIWRRIYGDDPVRVWLDSVKHPSMPKNVLFNRKNGYEAELIEKWEEGFGEFRSPG
jgi:hypothetical protein